jgi:probable addiction module antidote protein
MPESFFPYDPAEALDTIEAINIFMADAFETGDAAHIAAALGVVARAKGISQFGSEAGLSPEPTLNTILAAMKTLGMQIAVTTRNVDDARAK